MDALDSRMKLQFLINDCRDVLFLSFFFEVGLNEPFSEISQRLQNYVLKPKVPQAFEFMKMEKWDAEWTTITQNDTCKTLEFRDYDCVHAQSHYFETNNPIFEFVEDYDTDQYSDLNHPIVKPSDHDHDDDPTE